MRMVDLGYVAGLLDGEGCLSSDRTFPRVRIGMTDLDALERCREITGLGTIHGPYLSGVRKKPYYTWNVGRSKDAASLIMTLYPLLSARRQEQARKSLLDWHAMRGRVRNALGQWSAA